MSKLIQIAGALCLLAFPAQAAVLYSGHDTGAGSLATATNSTTAANAFDAATGALSIIDFESATPGFSVTGDGFVRNTQRCLPVLCGYNTTSGGSNFLDVTYNTVFHFATAINAFGAYFTGVQRGDATLTYTDGSTVVMTMPAADLSSGGTTFFGFTDIGKSITSIAYFTGIGGDFVGVDDIRFGNVAAVPVPAALPLLIAGIGAIGFAGRRKKRKAAL